ncbi:hypothetical protein M513_12696 [Trichuris suis]|uniref:Uncharacterized protein n=1 Tax=Trichuris suis TaxID=68888 RepID=A0A085LN85_9BILA|nr:hypothetical protein M513_12696 [Trichuris suis]
MVNTQGLILRCSFAYTSNPGNGPFRPQGAPASQGGVEDQVALDRRRLIIVTSATLGAKTPINHEIIVTHGRTNALVSLSDPIETTGYSHLSESRLADRSFRRQFADRSLGRQVIWVTGRLADWSFNRQVVWPNGRLAELSFG